MPFLVFSIPISLAVVACLFFLALLDVMFRTSGGEEQTPRDDVPKFVHASCAASVDERELEREFA